MTRFDTGSKVIGHAIVAERRSLTETLTEVGPDAPTLCIGWNAADLAAHVASLDRAAGIPTFLGRWLVFRRGTRLNAPATRFPRVAELGFRGVRRRGFEWSLHQLRQDPPELLLRPSVRVVGLFEVWVHHQDVRLANRMRPSEPGANLSVVIPWLLRYQRQLGRKGRLRVDADGHEWQGGEGIDVEISGPTPEIVLWLAGRAVEGVRVEGAIEKLRGSRRV